MNKAAEARSVMRLLLRARMKAFKGDKELLDSSAKHVREMFEANRCITDPVELDKHLTDGREAAQFLIEGLVQAKLNERGNYEMKLTEQHAGKTFEDLSSTKIKPE